WIARIAIPTQTYLRYSSQAESSRYMTAVPGGNLLSGIFHFFSCRQSTANLFGGADSTVREATFLPFRTCSARPPALPTDASTCNRLPPTIPHPRRVSNVPYTGAFEESTTSGHTCCGIEG